MVILISIEEIFNELKHIKNPTGDEDDIIAWAKGWLKEKDIKIEKYSKWGIYCKIRSDKDSDEKNGILFVAHLDSEEDDFDDKTGIAVILDLLDDIVHSKQKRGFAIHSYFSVLEEAGQKGSSIFPMELIFGKVRYGILVDRKSSYYNKKTGNRRHYVNEYCGVPTILPSGHDRFTYKGNDYDGIANVFSLVDPTLVSDRSPYCSDAIELRGRWDAEFIAPLLRKQNLIEDYKKKTDDVIEQYIWDTVEARRRKVSSYKTRERKARYDVMKKIYEELYSHQIGVLEDYMKFSVVNLSMDYNKTNIQHTLEEMNKTKDLLIKFLDVWNSIIGERPV